MAAWLTQPILQNAELCSPSVRACQWLLDVALQLAAFWPKPLCRLPERLLPLRRPWPGDTEPPRLQPRVQRFGPPRLVAQCVTHPPLQRQPYRPVREAEQPFYVGTLHVKMWQEVDYMQPRLRLSLVRKDRKLSKRLSWPPPLAEPLSL